MKNKSILLLGCLLFISGILISQDIKPYTLALQTNGTVQEMNSLVQKQLINHGFQILGEYAPDHNSNSRVIAFTSKEIIEAVEKVGGLSGFAMAWRVAITPNNGMINITYTNPEYWGNAYFQYDFKKVVDLYKYVTDQLESTMNACGSTELSYFGSEDGMPAKRIQNYRYKVLMPQFDDTDVVGKFDSYADAIAAIDFNLKTNAKTLTQVYSIKLPGKNIKLYGIGIAGENGEGKFMPKIDINGLKHTAFLPYEILVVDNKVHMLAGRYRIALSFPDLSMGTFMKIVSTPGDIKDNMELLCKKLELDN